MFDQIQLFIKEKNGHFWKAKTVCNINPRLLVQYRNAKADWRCMKYPFDTGRNALCAVLPTTQCQQKHVVHCCHFLALLGLKRFSTSSSDLPSAPPTNSQCIATIRAFHEPPVLVCNTTNSPADIMQGLLFNKTVSSWSYYESFEWKWKWAWLYLLLRSASSTVPRSWKLWRSVLGCPRWKSPDGRWPPPRWETRGVWSNRTCLARCPSENINENMTTRYNTKY